MKRRSLRKTKAAVASGHRHCVYVALLDEAARSFGGAGRSSAGDKDRPCVYVGMTGLSPQERFENHKKGIKAAKVVMVHGLRLLPELFEHLNPMPYDAALRMEADLADDLRAEGYCVFGGH